MQKKIVHLIQMVMKILEYVQSGLSAFLMSNAPCLDKSIKNDNNQIMA